MGGSGGMSLRAAGPCSGAGAGASVAWSLRPAVGVFVSLAGGLTCCLPFLPCTACTRAKGSHRGSLTGPGQGMNSRLQPPPIIVVSFGQWVHRLSTLPMHVN